MSDLDIPGTLLATLGLGGLTFGLIRAGANGLRRCRLRHGPWRFGARALVGFFLVERRSRHPMIPLRLFRLPVFAGIQVFTFLLWSALSGALFFVPFRLMQVQGFGPLQAGGALLPCVVVISILSRWAGGLADRWGAQRPLIAGSLIAGLRLSAARPSQALRRPIGSASCRPSWWWASAWVFASRRSP